MASQTLPTTPFARGPMPGRVGASSESHAPFSRPTSLLGRENCTRAAGFAPVGSAVNDSVATKVGVLSVAVAMAQQGDHGSTMVVVIATGDP